MEAKILAELTGRKHRPDSDSALAGHTIAAVEATLKKDQERTMLQTTSGSRFLLKAKCRKLRQTWFFFGPMAAVRPYCAHSEIPESRIPRKIRHAGPSSKRRRPGKHPSKLRPRDLVGLTSLSIFFCDAPGASGVLCAVSGSFFRTVLAHVVARVLLIRQMLHCTLALAALRQVTVILASPLSDPLNLHMEAERATRDFPHMLRSHKRAHMP